MNWFAKAEALGAFIKKPELHPQAVQYMNSSDSAIGVACSGGADSVAALLLVFLHLPEIRPRLSVLHFNHKLRGIASDEDAAFVESIASSLNLPFLIGDWDDRDLQKQVSEAVARDARQAFYDSFSSNHSGGIIVTGHHQDDILETLMLRIARSSNLTGLASPKPVSEFANGKAVVRPLLDLKKATLVSVMTEVEIEWREDDSNSLPTFDRNRLRNEVIPAWQKATQFDLSQAAGKVREYLAEADEVVDRYLEESNFPSTEENPARFSKLSFPRGAIRRWLLLWLNSQGLGGAFQLSMVNEILGALMNREKKQWSAGKAFIQVDAGGIRYSGVEVQETSWSGEFELSADERVVLPNGKSMFCKWVQPTDQILTDLKKGKYSEQYTVLIDSEVIQTNSFVIHPWNPGDRYQALNAPGSRKLQDMFVDRKIPKEERIHLPVVHTTDSVILWCPGLPVNHNYRVTQKTKEILQLTYT